MAKTAFGKAAIALHGLGADRKDFARLRVGCCLKIGA
jgi:predicted esterase